MVVEDPRISQVLPSVKCSKCGSSIQLDAIGVHVCSSPSTMPSILESPQRSRSNEAQRGRFAAKLPQPFDSSNYARAQNTRLIGGELRNVPQIDPHLHSQDRQDVHSGDQKPKYSNAKAVLGRLNTIKPGPLDSSGMRRPTQQGRMGPIENRDPRATMVPLKMDTGRRFQGKMTPPLPSPAMMSASGHWPEDDIASIRSGRSNASGRSQHSSGSRNAKLSDMLNEPQDDLYSIALMHGGSPGPYHHVSTSLNPAIFHSDSSSSNSSRAPSRHKDAYGDEWEERGVEADSVISLLPEAPKRRPGLRKLPSQTSLDSRASNNSNRSQGSQRSTGSQLVHRQPQAMRLDEWHKQRRRPDKHISDESYDAYDSDRISPQKPTFASKSSRTHARTTTSSSLGTVLTTSTFESARSSSSSASPLSTHDFSRNRYDSVTPTPQFRSLDQTPKASIHVAQRMQVPKGMPRSNTDQSLDRLLNDIGNSIESLEIPKPQTSPSSDYSPVKKDTRLASPIRAREPSPERPSRKKGYPCQGCDTLITGKSISSKDGKLLGKWHKHCFLCTTCHSPFANSEFYVFRNKPYCQRHYHAQNGSLCVKCGDVVEGDCIADQDGRYHLSCHSSPYDKF